MPKLTILILVFSLLTFYSYAQNNDRVLLLYAEKETYLLPLIENALRNFRDTATAAPLFQKVINFNKIADNVKYEKLVREVSNYYTDKNFRLSPEAEKLQEEISSQLSTRNSFLTLHVNLLHEIIEVQFTLYRSIKGSSPSARDETLPVNMINKMDKSLSVFIDPRNPKYKLYIENALKQLFAEANFAPVARIKVNNRTPSDKNSYFFAAGDTITMDASVSTDRDSPRENFIYQWRQIDLTGKVNVTVEESIGFAEQDAVQSLVIQRLGRYALGLKVSDGVKESKEDTIRIEIIQRPVIDTAKVVEKLYVQRALFPGKKNTGLEGEIYLPMLSYGPGDYTLQIQSRRFRIYQYDSLQILKMRMASNRFNSTSLEASLPKRDIQFTPRQVAEGYIISYRGNVRPGKYSYLMNVNRNEVESVAAPVDIHYEVLPPFTAGIGYRRLPLRYRGDTTQINADSIGTTQISTVLIAVNLTLTKHIAIEGMFTPIGFGGSVILSSFIGADNSSIVANKIRMGVSLDAYRIHMFDRDNTASMNRWFAGPGLNLVIPIANTGMIIRGKGYFLSAMDRSQIRGGGGDIALHISLR